MFNILNFDEVDSTNKLAFDLIKKGQAQNNTMIIANKQTKGRGRLDRDWESEKGNLFCSIILQFRDDIRVSDYSFITALVIHKTLEEFNIQTKLKWPNDIIFEGKKLSGILLQYQNIHNINNLVIGIGLNLKTAPNYAISLAKYDISKEELVEKLSKIFLDYNNKYQQFGFEFIKNEWLKYAWQLNEEITLSNGKIGIFKTIDKSGSLILEDKANNLNKISADEIVS